MRADISLTQQIVQVGHACIEAGRQFHWPAGPSNLVVLSVPSQADLQLAVGRACLAGIQVALFHEPDNDLGLTAACTEPLSGPVRRIFKRFPLWNQANNIFERGPPLLQPGSAISAVHE